MTPCAWWGKRRTKIVNVAIVGGGLMGREIAAALQRWPALVDHPVCPQLLRSATSTRQPWTGSTRYPP